MNITLIESAIYDVMVSNRNIWKHLKSDNGTKEKLESDILRLSGDLSNVESQVQAKQKEKERLLNLYISGMIKDDALFGRKDGEIDEALSSLNNKGRIIKKALAEKKKAVRSFGDVKTSKEMMLNAKNDREQLRAMIQQVIGRVVIYPYTNNVVLLSMMLQTGGVHLGYGYIALDLSGLKKKPQQFRYMDLMTTMGEKDWGPEAMENNYDERNWKTIDESNLVELTGAMGDVYLPSASLMVVKHTSVISE